MTFHLLHTQGMSILKQLQLEEELLREDDRNFCLINEGSSPAIVMGISGKPEELVDLSQAKARGIPLLKRFSGGGTVIVDEDTVFVTFICQKHMHDFAPYPEAILRWSAGIYAEAFPPLALRENDYVIGEKKCGGNAQYIRKERWLHHTSFLWDYKKEHMDLLLHPKKTPAYRAGRSHAEFVTPLREHVADKSAWIAGVRQVLERRYQVVVLEGLERKGVERQSTYVEEELGGGG